MTTNTQNLTKQIPITKILCVDDRPHSAAYVARLKASILNPKVGMINAISIMPIEHKKYDYEVKAGRCRFNILKESGKKTFTLGGNNPEVAIKKGDPDAIAFAENAEREDLTLWQEVKYLENLVKKYASISDLANAINRSISWVARRINLLNLSRKWRIILRDNEMQFFGIGHFEVIATFNQKAQEDIFEDCQHNLSDERISVTQFENKLYKEYAPVLKDLPWNVDGKLKGCGKCAMCKEQENQSFLFEEYTNSGRCMNQEYIKKQRAKYIIKIAKDDPSLLLYTDCYGYYESNPLFEEEKVITNYDGQKVESPEDGEKALIVCGENIGTFVYFKKKSNLGMNQQNSSEPKVKKTLEERKEMKQRQRQRQAIDSLTEFLKEGKYKTPSRETIFALLACKGVSSAFFNAWNDLEKGESKIPDSIKSFATALAMDEAKLNKKVWSKLRYKLVEELNYGQTGPVVVKWEEAEIISQIISFDLEKALKEATTALPDLKSWAKEEAELQKAA